MGALSHVAYAGGAPETAPAPIPGFRPEILAPAGSRASALAALAAGADAIYLGLKSFSARMEADNFTLPELGQLAELAHAHGRRVHVAVNTLIKPDEIGALKNFLATLTRQVRPDALIIQDMGALRLARESGFAGEIHLSTLACVTSPEGLAAVARVGARRVVLPRELDIDEVRQMSAACPDNLALEIFVHGALCFCVSGRCLWSSYLGGKSGLRGRCVQPCRRVYAQGKGSGRFFSCQDLSLDVLVKTLLSVPRVTSWKIEGRRKGPHYVYYTTSAYVLLRDHPDDPQAKKTAQELLALALGRETTRARFLPQRPQPAASRESSASGLFVGLVRAENALVKKGAAKNLAVAGAARLTKAGAQRPGKSGARRAGGAGAKETPRLSFFLSPRMALAAGDLIRIGYEDEPGHFTFPLRRFIPRGGQLTLPAGRRPKSGMPAFLIDRREPELEAALRTWEERLAKAHPAGSGLAADQIGAEAAKTDAQTACTAPTEAGRPQAAAQGQAPGLPAEAAPGVCAAGDGAQTTPWPVASAALARELPRTIWLRAAIPQGNEGKPQKDGRRFERGATGLWLSRRSLEVSRTWFAKIVWWLPPVIWPDEAAAMQELVRRAVRQGAWQFVLGQPWQRAFFPDECASAPERPLALIAGPSCNIANPAAVAELKDMGFCAAFASLELSGSDMLALGRKAVLPLGALLTGFWPLGLSRFEMDGAREKEGVRSPKQELFWTRRYGQNTWLYADRPLDIAGHREELESAGYVMFAHVEERLPVGVAPCGRTSRFNWELPLL